MSYCQSRIKNEWMTYIAVLSKVTKSSKLRHYQSWELSFANVVCAPPIMGK